MLSYHDHITNYFQDILNMEIMKQLKQLQYCKMFKLYELVKRLKHKCTVHSILQHSNNQDTFWIMQSLQYNTSLHDHLSQAPHTLDPTHTPSPTLYQLPTYLPTLSQPNNHQSLPFMQTFTIFTHVTTAGNRVPIGRYTQGSRKNKILLFPTPICYIRVEKKQDLAFSLPLCITQDPNRNLTDHQLP